MRRIKDATKEEKPKRSYTKKPKPPVSELNYLQIDNEFKQQLLDKYSPKEIRASVKSYLHKREEPKNIKEFMLASCERFKIKYDKESKETK